MMKKSLFIFPFLLILAIQTSIYDRYYLTAPDALCLDGTPGAYYIANGTGANAKKFVIYFEGGGWCGDQDLGSTIENCYQRSFSDLGSSKNYGTPADLSSTGYLSGEQSVNPTFWDWTKVYIKYCTGTGHQGTKSEPINYKGVNLYFRGQNVTIAILRTVNITHKLFTEGVEILVTGASAGGLATFTWTNYIVDHSAGKVWSAPDSGIFLDVVNVNNRQPMYRNQFINFMKISNVQVNQPVYECNQAYPNQLWRCMFGQNLWKFIRAPLFPINPLYDSWSVPNILGIYCLQGQSMNNCNQVERNYLEQYRVNTTNVVNEIVKTQGNGAWCPSCADHTYAGWAWTSSRYRVPENSVNSLDYAMNKWMRDPTSQDNAYIDSVSWPNNHPCSGIGMNLMKE